MRKYIVHVSWIFFYSLMIFAVGAVQFGIHYGIKDKSMVADVVSCQLQNIESNEVVKLNLRCGERSAYITTPKQVVAVLNHTGPLTCKLFKSGRAECTRTGN